MANPDLSRNDDDQKIHPTDDIPGGPPDDSPPEDPKYYELVIDNDSGTYRPNADLLPTLQKYLESNFPGLRILTKACDDEELKQIKEDQKKAKLGEGEHMVFGQGSDTSSSISSSDESDLEDRVEGKPNQGSLGQGVAAIVDPKGTAKNVFGGGEKRDRREKKGNHDEDRSMAMPSTKRPEGGESEVSHSVENEKSAPQALQG